MSLRKVVDEMFAGIYYRNDLEALRLATSLPRDTPQEVNRSNFYKIATYVFGTGKSALRGAALGSMATWSASLFLPEMEFSTWDGALTGLTLDAIQYNIRACYELFR